MVAAIVVTLATSFMPAVDYAAHAGGAFQGILWGIVLLGSESEDTNKQVLPRSSIPSSLIQLLLCGADGPAIHRRGDCSGDLRDGYLLLGGEAEAVQVESRLLGDQRRLASLGLSPPSGSWTCTLCIYCSPVCLLVAIPTLLSPFFSSTPRELVYVYVYVC